MEFLTGTDGERLTDTDDERLTGTDGERRRSVGGDTAGIWLTHTMKRHDRAPTPRVVPGIAMDERRWCVRRSSSTRPPTPRWCDAVLKDTVHMIRKRRKRMGVCRDHGPTLTTKFHRQRTTPESRSRSFNQSHGRQQPPPPPDPPYSFAFTTITAAERHPHPPHTLTRRRIRGAARPTPR